MSLIRQEFFNKIYFLAASATISSLIVVLSLLHSPFINSGLPQVNAINNSTLLHIHKSSKASGVPIALNIPKLNLAWDVDKGFYNPENDSWTLSDDRVYYATPSALINDSYGGTVLYAHNRDHLFKPLYNLKTDDKINITTDSNFKFTYALTSRNNVEPSDVSVLKRYYPEPHVVLQTCDGPFNEWRRLYEFKLISFERIAQ